MAQNAILLVDDNDINIELMTRVLKRTPYKVTVAYNGRDARHILDHNQFAMIISDIMMPFVDGYALLDYVRNSEAHAEIPFVFVSAKSSAADITKGMDLGANDYLPKPFRPRELLDIVEKYLPATA